jgi:hypothetical protein
MGRLLAACIAAMLLGVVAVGMVIFDVGGDVQFILLCFAGIMFILGGLAGYEHVVRRRRQE